MEFLLDAALADVVYKINEGVLSQPAGRQHRRHQSGALGRNGRRRGRHHRYRGGLQPPLRAIYYAADNGADVINMSFSFPEANAELQRALDYGAILSDLVVEVS